LLSRFDRSFQLRERCLDVRRIGGALNVIIERLAICASSVRGEAAQK